MTRLTAGRFVQLPPYLLEVQRSGEFYYSLNDPERLYLSRAGLRRSGWTGKLIDAILPKPCRRAENPHNELGVPMVLYSLARVQRLEQRSDVGEQVSVKLEKRKARLDSPPRPNDTPDLKSGVQMQQLGLALELPIEQLVIEDLARDF